MKKYLTSIQDLTRQEIEYLFEVALTMKGSKGHLTDILKGKSVGLVFQKPSNRTRVSFEVAIWQLGGNCIYLGPEEIKLGERETTADVAKTLSRYLDGIVARTHSHQDVLDLAKYATVPVVNGLSDLFHPCQALADLLTVKEKLNRLKVDRIKEVTLAYVGDGNNVCHSLMIGAAKLGLRMNIATPKGYEPKKEVVNIARSLAEQSEAQIHITNVPQDAVRGAHVIYTDVWTSMGQEAETQQRLTDFKEFQIDKNLTLLAHRDFLFMHCLPAHRGEEVTDEIIDGPHSVVFDQAENRLHIQKAILIQLLGELV